MLRRSVAVCLLLELASGAAHAAGATELRFAKLNRVYDQLAGEMAPLSFDPIEIRLSSPRQVIVVKDHLVTLRPLGGGRFEGRVEIEFLGKGELVADIDLGSGSQRLTDEVLMPRQRVVIDGVASIRRSEGGYRVLLESLPPSLRVEIRSRLINQLLDLCAGASLLSLGALDCTPLAGELERPRIPLDGAARELFLPDGDLADEERQALDALLVAP